MNGLEMKYFVLKPKGNDRHAEASRKALRAYALHIANENKQLSDELREWAMRETNIKIGDNLVVCPICGCNKMTGDGSKSWCLNSDCDFIEAD